MTTKKNTQNNQDEELNSNNNPDKIDSNTKIDYFDHAIGAVNQNDQSDYKYDIEPQTIQNYPEIPTEPIKTNNISEKNEQQSTHNPNHMPTKKVSMSVLWFILALIIFITLSTFAGFSYYNNYQNQLPTSKILVTATEKTKVKPDTATNNFFISITGKNLAELNIKADVIRDKFLNYLKEQGISDKDVVVNKNSYPYYGGPIPLDSEIKENSVSSSSVSVDMVTEDANKPSTDILSIPSQFKEDQTTLEISMLVTIKDVQTKLDSLDKITSKALELGVNRVSGYNFSLSQSEIVCRDLKAKAVDKAIKEGQEQVERLGGDKIIRKEINDLNLYADNCSNYNDIYRYSSDTVSSQEPSTLVPDLTKSFSPMPFRENELQVTVQLVLEYR